MKPVLREHLNYAQRKKLLRSHMFLKLKRDGKENVEKMKSRLVGDGRTQDREFYSDLKSPTADIESVFMMFKLASRLKLKATKVDFLAAYLNAKIEDGDHIFMWLTRELTDILIIYFPELKGFIGKDGRLIVKILKALYGLVQSAALWFAMIYGYLTSLGFKSNWVSVCILNMTKDGRELTLILYVDDILILWKDYKDAEWLIEKLNFEFDNSLTHKTSRGFTYLGMYVEIDKEGRYSVDMEDYQRNAVLSYCKKEEEIMEATTPASKELFKLEETAKRLDEKRRKNHHSAAAKILYVTNQIRTAAKVACGFACTRVQAATVNDKKKLRKLLGYLWKTKAKKMLFGRGDGSSKLEFYIDGAFAIHSDAKSHEGLVVALGGSVILVWSKKQKICTKDSTEAELVAVSDFCPMMEWVKDFLVGQGVVVSETIIYQDNTSTMKISEIPECGKLRTRYIKACAGVANEFVCIRKVAKMKHVCTDFMLADVATKPIGVALFEIFEDRLMNITGHDEFKSKIIALKKNQREIGSEQILAATFENLEAGSNIKKTKHRVCNDMDESLSCNGTKSDERSVDGPGIVMAGQNLHKKHAIGEVYVKAGICTAS